MINYAEVEERWQKRWREAGLFEGSVNDKRPYFITAAFPYANAPQHIGHLRTYGTADTLARYKRMRGYNVLYPMGFHATGTPVLAFAKRIRNNDHELISELKDLFHIPMEDITKMTDPVFIANYFVGELEKGMHAAGYSIDWRRKFISIEPLFSKFIEWQFGILNSKGYLTKGRHPVGWCPNENNAVGMHDTKRDVEPEIDKVTVIKFKVDELNAYALCATFRPETIHGVTNLFVNENATYLICKINDDGQQYILSKASADDLRFQMKIDDVKRIRGSELLSMKCLNPANDATVPILPGFFVEERRGTGVVMSVPAHAPFDYVALEKLRSSGYNLGDIKPIKVMEVEVGRSLGAGEKKAVPVHTDIPALAYLEIVGGDAGSSQDVIELATKVNYKEESHWGRMIVEGYKGMTEEEARRKIKEMLESKRMAFEIYVLTNEKPVICRCGYNIVVKVVENQWFINYGDRAWKETVKEAFKDIKILPEGNRNAMAAAIDWIDLRAVARAQGLGTKFPFDKEFIIESLSDSTIYMALYTISNLIRGVEVGKLKPAFFDYVFLDKGDPDAVAKHLGIDYEIIKKSKESFDYWYNETSRHSGPDLIFNHLTMYIFNHVGIFDKRRWPKQIVVNGFVLSEGEKMSKSIGNIMPLVDAIKKYGADPIRAVTVAGADLLSDSDYSDDAVNGVRERFNYIYELCTNIESYETEELHHIDYWLYSKLNRKIEAATSSLERLELRDAFTNILYNSVLELKRYSVRGGKNGMVLRDYLSTVVLMLQPIAPHVSEEFWHTLGNSSFSSTEKWPMTDRSLINEKIERGEDLLTETIVDIKQIMELLAKKGGNKPKVVSMIVADDWKREINNKFEELRDIGKVIAATKELKGINMEKASRYITSISKRKDLVTKSELKQDEEFNIYEQSKDYMKGMLNVEISIEKEHESGSQRADRALPLKPSIDVR